MIAKGSNNMTSKTIALLGIGHTNAHVVREWASNPIPNCRLVCISKFPFATYSGMLPGTLAGQFAPAQMQIDLQPLVQRAGGELILDEVIGLDASSQSLQFANRGPLNFDALSIGVGSMPAGWNNFRSPAMVSIKPMQTFVRRLDERLDTVLSHQRTPTITIVGGGVSGVEVALCLHRRVMDRYPTHQIQIRIVTQGNQIAEGLNGRSVRRLRRILASRLIDVVHDFDVVDVTESAVINSSGHQLPSDCVIWATGATAPPILGKLNLPTDNRGFLATERTLKTTADLPVFAVGDSGTVISDPSPKAGVYAVRQSRILWHNLRAKIAGSPLIDYEAQSGFLKIVNTGDGKALLDYGRLSIHHRWCWHLKSWIDRRFISDYQLTETKAISSSPSASTRAA